MLLTKMGSDFKRLSDSMQEMYAKKEEELRNMKQELIEKEEMYKNKISNHLLELKCWEDKTAKAIKESKEETDKAMVEVAKLKVDANKAKEETSKLKDDIIKLKESERALKDNALKVKEEANKAMKEAARLKEEIVKLKLVEQTLKDDALKAREEKEMIEAENEARKKQETDYLETISILQNQNWSLAEKEAEVSESRDNLREMWKRNLNGQLKQVKIGFQLTNSPLPDLDDSGLDLATGLLQIVDTPPRDAIKNEMRCSGSQAVKGRRGRKRLALDYDFEHAEDTNRSSAEVGAFYCSCGSLFPNKAGLKGHVDRENNRNLGCLLCDERFYYYKYFINHLQKQHKITLDGGQQTGCLICKAIFTERDDYVVHYKDKHFSAECEMACRPEPLPAEIFKVYYDKESK